MGESKCDPVCFPRVDFSLPARMTNLLLHWLALGMQPGSAKLEWRRRLHEVSLHSNSSMADLDSMTQASQWSSSFVILAGQAGQGNVSLTEILTGRNRNTLTDASSVLG